MYECLFSLQLCQQVRFLVFCKYNRWEMVFWCSWLGFYGCCSGGVFWQATEHLFIVVLIYVYFMSEIGHILAAVHTDTRFTMNDSSLPIFLLSVYICVTYSTLLYLYIKDGSPLWYECWIIFPACQLSFGSAGSGVDVQTCIFVSEISSHFSYSVRISCHRKKDFPWAEYKKFSHVFRLVLLWLTFLILKSNTFGIYPGEWYEGCTHLYFLTKN